MSRILHLQHQDSGSRMLSSRDQVLHGRAHHAHRQLHADGGTGTRPAAVPQRYVTRRNQLVAGVFIHQARIDEHVDCHGHFSEKLAPLCQLAADGHLSQGAFRQLFSWCRHSGVASCSCTCHVHCHGQSKLASVWLHRRYRVQGVTAVHTNGSLQCFVVASICERAQNSSIEYPLEGACLTDCTA